MSFISLIIAPIIATLFGWVLTRIFRIYLPFLERLALSYVFGLAGITILMFYLNLASIPFSVGSALLVPVLAILLLGLRERSKISAFVKKPKKKLTKFKAKLFAQWQSLSFLERLTLMTIIFLILTALARALYWPVFYWDAICAYDARAQFFLQDGLMTKVAQKVSWQFHNYPPFTSLAHTFFYLLGAHNPKILYTLIYIAFLVTMYYSLRAHTSRLLSLALTLLLAANPFVLEHAAASYTNLAYTFFLGMGTIYLVRFLEKKELPLFWTGTFLFALSAWTRPSPEWFFFSALAVLVIFVVIERKHFWLPIVFTFVFLAIWLPWPFFLKFSIGQEHLRVAAGSKTLSIIEDMVFGTLQGRIDRETFFRMMKLLLSVTRRSLSYILYLFLIAFFFNIFDKKMLRKTIYLLFFIAIYAGTVFLGVYSSLFTWHDWQNLVANAVNRFVMIFLPLLIYYIGLTFSGEKKK